MPAEVLTGLHLTPQVADAEKEMDFLQAALNATPRLKHRRPDGAMGHCEVRSCRSQPQRCAL